MASAPTLRQIGPLPFWDSDLQARDDLSGNGPVVGQSEAPLSVQFPRDYGIYATNPWDLVTLGGQKLPGICEVDSRSMRDISVKQAKGRTGARYTILGYKPSEVVIRVHLWSPEQFTIFRGIMGTFWARGEKDPFPNAIPIYHPGLALWGIKAVVIAECDTPKPGKSVGIKTFTLKCQECTQAKKGKAKLPPPVGVPGVVANPAFGPTGSTPGAVPQNTNTPVLPSTTDGNFAANLLGGGP